VCKCVHMDAHMTRVCVPVYTCFSCVCVCVCGCVCVDVCVCVCAHMYKHTYTLPHTNTNTLLWRASPRALSFTHTSTEARALSLSHTHPPTHQHPHYFCAHKHALSIPCTSARALSLAPYYRRGRRTWKKSLPCCWKKRQTLLLCC